MPAQFTISTTGEKDIRIALARWNEVSHPRRYLDNLADWVAQEEAKQFAQEGGAYPPKWARLSPSYAARKARIAPGKRILHLTGELEKSLTRRPFGVEHISADSLTVGTNVPYAIYHQRGTRNMPARPPLIRINRGAKESMRAMLQRWIVEH